MPTATADGPATVAELAARHNLPRRHVLARLNRDLAAGKVTRHIDPETSVARWSLAPRSQTASADARAR